MKRVELHLPACLLLGAEAGDTAENAGERKQRCACLLMPSG